MYFSHHLLVLVIGTLLAVPGCNGGLYSHTVYIDPSTGNDTESCITSNSPSVPCKSLNWAFLPKHRSNSTQYVLLNGPPHQSNDSIETFENLHTIAFTGSKANTTIHCTERETGLAFKDVSQLVFTNITFLGCSSERNSTSRNFSVSPNQFVFSTMQVTLYFYHCRDVNMLYINVDRPGSGATGVVMYDTDGTNTISHCSFTNCTVEPKRPGGGGFYVEFSYCVPGDVSCSKDGHVVSFESRNRNAKYQFLDCTFSLNEANNIDESNTLSTYIIPYRSEHEAFGRGGGLSIYFKGNATGNIFDIANCTFDSNEALWGGGFFVEFQDDTNNNTLLLSQSTFTRNKGHISNESGTDGGGMRLAHYVYKFQVPDPLLGNNVTMVDCEFTENIALNGGGLSIFPARQESSPDLIASVSIIRTNFSNNVAKLGSGIHVSPFSLFTVGHMLNVTIKQCNFLSNNVSYIGDNHKQPFQVGIGTVYANQVELIFQENVMFYSNNGSALAVIGTSVDFTGCDATFEKNTGDKGGAIALLGAAFIKIGEKTHMDFYENIAMSEGGAIYNRYIERETLKSYTDCFIRYGNPFIKPENWTASFRFDINYHHGYAGLNAIHSSSLLPCARAGGNGIASEVLFCQKPQFKYFPSFGHILDCKHYLTSDVGIIEYSDNVPNVKAFPGAPFTLPVKILDEYSRDVSNETVFAVSADYPQNSTLHNDFDKFLYFWGESATIKGGQNEVVTLQLDSIGDRAWHMEVIVELQSCPPGFQNIPQEEGDTICDCPHDYNGALTCEIGIFRSSLENNHWMGMIDGQENYIVGRCPPGYCNISHNSSQIILPTTNDELQEMLCKNISRNGTLCGKCIEGLGPAVNSLTYECIPCSGNNVSISSNIAKYVASVYIPLFFMFTILILFDIRLTTGPANAFILYSQVVASTFDLNADGQIPLDMITNSSESLLEAYRVVYGVFNLEFIEKFLHPLCLGTHFNNLSVFLLDYAVAISPLLMILFVMVCVKLKGWIEPKCCRNNAGNRWDRVTSMSFTSSYKVVGQRVATQNRRINKAILPAFAAFVLLSYTKFSTVSSYLVRYQTLINDDGTPAVRVVYYAGHYLTSDTTYLHYYFLPAIFVFATFVFIPPLLLLDYPLRAFERCISKADFLWRFYPVDKVHVFLDTFQGCYKNKMRFFAGLYFVFRLIINTSYVVTHSWLEQFVVQQLACTIMIILLALFQPYNDENKLFNYVDILIFANLAALNALSFYMYSFSLYNPLNHPPTPAFAFQYLLVFLPLIYMLSYILWSVTKPFHHKLKNGVKETALAVIRMIKGTKSTQLESVAGDTGIATPINSVHEDEASVAQIEAMLSRAELENTYRPSSTHCDPPIHPNKGNTSSENTSLRSSMSSPAHYYGSTTESSKDSDSKLTS